MAKQFVRDRVGNEIYLTDERWQHIIEFHPEMVDHRQQLFSTIKTGRRMQDALDPTLYTYSCYIEDLEKGFNHVVVVVKFGFTTNGRQNNFVLTAFQKFVY